MNLQELLAKLDTPIVIRPTRRMTQGELETYLDHAANILRGNADHSEFRGYVFALLFYKRINDCYDEEVRNQSSALVKAGVPIEQALALGRDPQNHHFIVPAHAVWADVARTAKGQLGQALNDAMLSIERANAHRQNNFDGKADKFGLQKGDLLVERSGGGPDQPVGRIGFVANETPGATVSNFVQVLRPDPEKVDASYLGWALFELQRTGIIERVQQQSAQMRNLNWRDYQRLLFPWPEVDEQRRIAGALRLADYAIQKVRAPPGVRLACVGGVLAGRVQGDAPPNRGCDDGSTRAHRRLRRGQRC